MSKDKSPWPLGGYAPGRYRCICHTCKTQFDGDKRAYECLPCAATAAAPRLKEVERLRSALKPLARAASQLLIDGTRPTPDDWVYVGVRFSAVEFAAEVLEGK